jgi:DNA replication protein DnaC
VRKNQEADDKAFQEQLKKNARRGYSSLSEKDWQVTFESLEIVPQNTEQVTRLKKWNPSMQRGVVLYGSVGTGKSTLCKAVINRFCSRDYRCLFISVADAMQRLKDAIDKEGTSVGHETEKLIEPNLLLLDDLGAEKSTEWATERLFVIFEKRAAQQKHTFFTTNLTPEQISGVYKERIKDRMIEFCTWVKFEGESFRKLKYVNEI